MTMTSPHNAHGFGRRVSILENKLIFEICELLPTHLMLISEAERLDLLIGLPEGERDMLINLCARIVTTAADGKRIKLEQLQERYADDLINK